MDARRLGGTAVMPMMVAVALTAAACTGGGSAGPAGAAASSRPAVGGRVLSAPPTLRPLALGSRPLWTRRAPSIDGAVLRGDAAIVRTADARDAGSLTVMDAATGRPRWSVKEFGPLRRGGGAEWMPPHGAITPHVVGVGTHWGVLVDYFSTACRSPVGLCPSGSGPSDEIGLALLSGEDGGVRWKTPLVPARTGKAGAAARRAISILVTANDTIALSIVKRRADARGSDVRLVAIDVATGRRLWSRSGVHTPMIADGVVLGQVTAPEQSIDVLSGGGAAIALDPATGRTRWDLSTRLPGTFPALTAGDLVMIRTLDGGRRLSVSFIVEAGTGRVLATLPSLVADCQSDGESLIACLDGRDRLLTIDTHDRTVKVSGHSLRSGRLETVWRDRVFIDDDRAGADHGVVELDRSANRVADSLPGRPLALADTYAIVAFSTAAGMQYSAYRVGAGS